MEVVLLMVKVLLLMKVVFDGGRDGDGNGNWSRRTLYDTTLHVT
jgi:hypothetical protein